VQTGFSRDLRFGLTSDVVLQRCLDLDLPESITHVLPDLIADRLKDGSISLPRFVRDKESTDQTT
jgi:hypothetical protein